ncbi:hypothetical protein [Fibrella forsythiae]|uniref:Curlin associated repeat-containing protein n=1 Tax=Fibrella forsythiae TaxID=2817061 RepID=A0ABS3JF19_9BACT|nr:hypothetical protein [Fibrella forsythiae]MBO0948592.1 hypothetical protein [Fibrella forsythiae]
MNKVYFFSLLISLPGGVMAQSSEAYWRPGITPTSAQALAALSTGTGGTGNAGTAAVVIQNGASNRFSFDGAAGNTGNQITFNQQGSNNQLDFALTGSNNTFTFDQLGNNNVLNLQNFSTSGTKLDIQQTGNNNQLESNGSPFADSTIPLKITQSGGMRLLISSSTGNPAGFSSGQKQ